MSSGLISQGVVSVESTSSGTPASWAMVETVAMSSTSSPGLPTVSPKNSLVFGAHGGAPAVDVAGFDEGGLDAEAAHRVVQQVLRAAVQRRGGHDVRARAHQRGDGQVQRRLAAGGGDGADAAFQRRDALLQHRIGRVADAGVDVAGAFQVEQRLRVFAGLEDERGASGGSARPARPVVGSGAAPACRASVSKPGSE